MSRDTTSRLQFVQIRDGLEELERTLGGYAAVTILVESCRQRLDGRDQSVPVSPEALAVLLETLGDTCRAQLARVQHNVAHCIDQGD